MGSLGTMTHDRPLEAEARRDSFSDYDSDGFRSELTSLKSSVLEYQYENGRRYHAFRAGQYILPNDDKEQERLDVLHHVFRLTLNGGLCRTRLDNPQRILDIGTGTGIWAIQVGDEYPSAEVIGIDLSPIQPGWTPPNVEFQVDDATQEWSFPEEHFDFIHARCLAGSIREWPALLERAYRHLKPGGRIELSEGRPHMCCDDNTFPDDCQTKVWIAEFHRIAHDNGLEFDMFPQYGGLLKSAGFENVEVREEITPVGPWPKDKKLKEIGVFFRQQFLEGAVEGYSLALFTRLGGWTDTETQVLLAHVRREIISNKMHVYTHCSYATAQKPLR